VGDFELAREKICYPVGLSFPGNRHLHVVEAHSLLPDQVHFALAAVALVDFFLCSDPFLMVTYQ
jgi:hypothetical protein